MVVDEIRDIIYHIRYKPGFIITVCETEENVLDIRYAMRTIDAFNFKKECTILGGVFLHCADIETEQDVLAFIYNKVIRQLEEHEMKEFFKYNDKLVYNPHP